MYTREWSGDRFQAGRLEFIPGHSINKTIRQMPEIVFSRCTQFQGDVLFFKKIKASNNFNRENQCNKEFTRKYSALKVKSLKSSGHRATIRFRPFGKFAFPDRPLHSLCTHLCEIRPYAIEHNLQLLDLEIEREKGEQRY